MKRIMPPTTLVVVLTTLFVIGNTSRARQESRQSAPTRACAAASDSPTQEPISLSRHLSPALSLRSACRPSTGEGTLTQPRR